MRMHNHVFLAVLVDVDGGHLRILIILAWSD